MYTKKTEDNAIAKRRNDGPICPVFMTLSLLANKWSVGLLDHLLKSPACTARFSELKKALGTITQRELTKHLRIFEESGIIERHVYPLRPPKVEYTLTALGTSLLEPITALSKWAEKHGAEIQKRREEYRKKYSQNDSLS